MGGKHMRNRRFVALAMAVVLSTSMVSVSVKAEGEVKEYVVVAENEKGQDIIDSDYDKIDTLQEDGAEENVSVVAMTQSEARKLERNKNIFSVEENIEFEASDIDETEQDDLDEQSLAEERELKLFLKELRQEQMTPVDKGQQWNIDVVNANNEEYQEGKDKIKVAVLDSGVALTEDIEIAGRVNFVEGEEDVHPLYEDVSGHGTSVASVIAAKDNNSGITGINPNVDLYSVKILNDDKKASLSDVIKGIYWCIDNDIDIINMSFGTSVESEILRKVVQEADQKGIIIVAAAGNQGTAIESTVEYPAAYDEVVAVGSITPQGKISEASSMGEEIDLMAPGEKVPALGYFDEVIETEGSSMAAPHVTGVASVLWAKDKSKSNDFIKGLLKASAKSIENAGDGLVDLDYALSIYDEYEKNYTDKGIAECKENKEEIQTYSNEQVEACWDKNDHPAAVGMYGALSAEDLNVIKAGAKLPDIEDYLKYAKGSTDSFHGHYNYIANYMYVMRMARKCSEMGMEKALEEARYPCSGAGKAQIKKGMSNLNNHWGDVLGGDRKNEKKRALILVGIATHIAMDAYAHKAYLKDSSTGQWTVHISGDPNQDSKTYVPSRWSCAKSIAYDILSVWDEQQRADAWEFYQPEFHNQNAFRMYKLSVYAKSADKTGYAEFSTFFDNRTCDVNKDKEAD